MTPQARIEDMGRYAADAIVEHQAYGPYYLAGISAGGLVMLEAAHRLTERRKRVALLAFLDTYPHQKFWPVKCWLEQVARHAKRQYVMVKGIAPGEATLQLAQLPLKVFRQLRIRAGETTQLASRSDPLVPPEVRQLQAAYARAVARYRPRAFPGRISFLKTECDTGFPADPTAVWESLGQDLDVSRIPCDHVAMITTYPMKRRNGYPGVLTESPVPERSANIPPKRRSQAHLIALARGTRLA
jgi:thioesterase domain-containing protein